MRTKGRDPYGGRTQQGASAIRELTTTQTPRKLSGTDTFTRCWLAVYSTTDSTLVFNELPLDQDLFWLEYIRPSNTLLGLYTIRVKS